MERKTAPRKTGRFLYPGVRKEVGMSQTPVSTKQVGNVDTTGTGFQSEAEQVDAVFPTGEAEEAAEEEAADEDE
jgi:hypothetical protein